MKKERKSCCSKKITRFNAWLIPAMVQFVLSFWYERYAIIIDSEYSSLNWSTPISAYVSDSAEKYITYGLSKMLAFIIISLLWKTIFDAINRVIPLHISVIFGLTWILFQGFLIFSWPETSFGPDMFAMYYLAERLFPWYWQSAFTSIVYIASFMVFPHPITLSILQITAFVFVNAYLYFRLEKSLNVSLPVKIPVFFTFFFSTAYTVATSPYRGCMFTILCCFYVTLVGMDFVEKPQLTKRKALLLCLMTAFVMVWRSEGIILGISGIIVILLTYNCKTVEKLSLATGIVIVFMLLNMYQGIGNKKYYGSGYLVVSTLAPVQNILNSKSANTEYKGYKEDLETIDNYLAIGAFKNNAISAWRTQNYNNGYIDINQSGKKEDEKLYLKAAFRLIFHNVPIYIKGQLNFTFEANGINKRYDLGEYQGPDSSDSYFLYDLPNYGIETFFGKLWVNRWEYSNKRITVQKKHDEIRTNIYDFYEKYNIPVTTRCVSVALLVLIMLIEIVRLIDRRHETIGIGVLAIGVLGELAIIILTIPVQFNLYFTEIYYSAFFIVYMYFVSLVRKSGSKRSNHAGRK